MKKKQRKLGSVQRSFVGMRAVRKHVLCLTTGVAGVYDYVSVLQIEGISYDLKSEEEQWLINELYQAVLRTLPYAVQIVWRVLPLQLAEYLSHFSVEQMPESIYYRSYMGAGEALVGRSGVYETSKFEGLHRTEPRSLWEGLANSHSAFLEHLAERRALLDRKVYLIVRVEGMPADERPLWQRLLIPASQQRRTLAEHDAFERARQELDLRASEIARLLQTMGLSVQRLSGKHELAPFYYSCLTPSRASRYPLSRELIDGVDRPVRTRGNERGNTEKIGLIRDEQCFPRHQVAQELAASLQDEKRQKKEKRERKNQIAAQETQPLEPIVEAEGAIAPWTSLADLLAPASVEVAPDMLKIEDEYTRVMLVRQLPRIVAVGWLKPLSELDEPMEVSFHLKPRNSALLLQQFRRQQMAYSSSRILAQRSGQTPDPDMKVAESDVAELINRLASGEERMLDISMQVMVRGRSKQELETRTERIRSVLQSMLLGVRVATFEQEQAFRSCLPHGQELLKHGLLLDSRSASTMFPFISTSLFHPSGMLEGITPQGDPVVLDAWRPEMANANRLILGPPGWGKSYQVKTTIIRQALKFACLQHGRQSGKERAGSIGKESGQFQFIVIDPEREYGPLAEVLGGQVIRLAPGSTHHLNPFDLPAPVADNSGLLAQTPSVNGDRLADQVHRLHALLDLMLADRSMDGGGRLSAQEKGLLDRAIYETYRRAGITAKEQTQAERAPLLRDLYEVLESGVCGPDTTHLAQRLHRYVHGSLAGLFAGPTNIKLSNALIVFDVHDLETELRPIGLFLVSNFVWTLSFQSRLPRQLVVDEAATLFQYESGARFLEDLVRRARKHYLGVTIITQHPAILRNSSIPANCGTHVLMHQDATALDLVEKMFKLSPRELQLVRHLSKGQALFVTHDKRLQVRFAASELEHRLATSDPRELAVRAEQSKQRMAARPLSQAVMPSYREEGMGRL